VSRFVNPVQPCAKRAAKCRLYAQPARYTIFGYSYLLKGPQSDLTQGETDLSAKSYPLLILLMALSFAISEVATGADGTEKPALAQGITRLDFDDIASWPGALAVSADGRTAAHIEIAGNIVVWNTADLKTVKTIAGSNDEKKPTAVALNPDGTLAAIGYADSRLVLWSLVQDKPVRAFSGHVGAISALAFSPDGQLLASGADDATTQLWEVASGKRLRIFDSMLDDSGIPVAIHFSGDGTVLLVNEWQIRHYDVGRNISLWSIPDSIEISTRNDMAPPNSDQIMRSGQAVGGKGWFLAYTGNEGFMVERLDGCGPPRRLTQQRDAPPYDEIPPGVFADTVAADPLGRWVAAAQILKWDEKKSQEITFLGMNGNGKSDALALPGRVIALAPHVDGASVFALIIEDDSREQEPFSNPQSGALYRIPVPLRLLALPSLHVQQGAASCAPTQAVRQQQDYKIPEKPAELTVATNLGPDQLKQWKKRIIQWRQEWIDAQPSSFDFTVLDPETGPVSEDIESLSRRYAASGPSLPAIPADVKVACAATRNGRLAVLYDNDEVRVGRLKPSGDVKRYQLELEHEWATDHMALSADGQYLWLLLNHPDANTSGTYRLSSGKLVGSGYLLTPFPSRANRGVVNDARQFRLAVWDFDKAEIIARLPRQRNRSPEGYYRPLRAALSDDGKLLASGSYDGLVRVWNLDTHQMLGQGRIGGPVTALAFDEAGEQLAAGRQDGQITVFQIPAPE